MNRNQFFEWMNTCPTDQWFVVEIESDYCRVLFPLDEEDES